MIGRHTLRPIWVFFALLFLAQSAAAYEWSGKLTEATEDLTNSDPARRAGAVRGLVYFSLDEVRRHIHTALSDTSAIVQLAAMDALVETGAYEDSELLHRFLSDPDPVLRTGAARALGELGGRGELGVMIRTLGDGDPKVRAATIRALGRLGMVEVKVPLASMLSDSDPEVVVVAIEVLARIGDRTAVFPLLEKVKDPQVRIQLSAIRGLGQLGDPRAVLPLIGMLYSPHDDVRLAVVDALGRLGDGRASGHLIKLMWDVHKAPLGSRVIYALGDIGDPSAAEALLQVMRYSQTARAAADALKKIGPPVIPTVLEALRQSQDQSFQELCLSVLQYIQSLSSVGPSPREQIAAALVPSLRDRRLPEDALLATLLMGRSPSALGPIMDHFTQLSLREDDDIAGDEGVGDERRKQILTGLIAWGDARIARPLLKLYPRLAESERDLALEALGAAGDPAAVKILGDALEKGGAATQLIAARALSTIDHPDSGRLLLEQLRTERSHLLTEVAYGLGANTSTEVSQALLKVVENTNGEVLHAALQALAEHYRRAPSKGASKALLNLVENASDERVATRALDALGPHPIPGGVKVLDSRYEKAGLMLRTKIVQVLGDWRDPAARPLLIKALDARNHLLRAEAAWSLGQLGDASAAAAISGLLTDERWPVAINAAGALAHLKSPDTAEALAAQLDASSSFTRINALLALHRLDAAPDQTRLMKLAHREADPRLIEAVARILAARGTDEDKRALDTLAQQTSDPAASRFIARLQGKDLSTEAKGEGWIRYIFNDASRRMVGQRVIVILPDGTMLGRASDAAGEVRVEHLEEGHSRIVFLDDVFTEAQSR